jgi:DNA-binding LacI/PurR family transcriptional regulator
VLNNSAPVGEEVRTRVLTSVTALGYVAPSPRQTDSALQRAVVLLIPDILNPYFAEIARGVQDEGALSGIMAVLLDTTEDPQLEEQSLRTLAGHPIGGIIACGSRTPVEQLIAVRSRYKVPMVVVNRNIRHPEIPSVMVDSKDATYRATRHLLDLGHARIAFIAGPSTSEAAQSRRRGIEAALTEAGLSLPPEWSISSLPNVNGGFLAMSSLLAPPVGDRPTAVIVYNDVMALGALHAARAHRQRVPEDISIIGFDDIAMAGHANPPLTTISQPKYRMGRLAMQLLHRMIQGQPLPGEGYTLMESPLIVRGSTGPAATGSTGPAAAGNGVASAT